MDAAVAFRILAGTLDELLRGKKTGDALPLVKNLFSARPVPDDDALDLTLEEREGTFVQLVAALADMRDGDVVAACEAAGKEAPVVRPSGLQCDWVCADYVVCVRWKTVTDDQWKSTARLDYSRESDMQLHVYPRRARCRVTLLVKLDE